jgi:hypothetical protein
MGRPRKQKHDYYEATQGFYAGDLGVHIAAGTIVDARDPALKGREDLFKPWAGARVYDGQGGDETAADEPEPEIEAATAAPGEKRNR